MFEMGGLCEEGYSFGRAGWRVSGESWLRTGGGGGGSVVVKAGQKLGVVGPHHL